MPVGARKREKIGERGLETRRFRFDYLCIFLVFNMFFVLLLRDLLPALAFVALRSHTRSS
jgi:hypothetical protein